MTDGVRNRSRKQPDLENQEPQPDKPAFDMNAGELGATLAQVGKNYGQHVARTASTRVAIKHCPTGIFTLDLALLGGIPEGLCSMLFGWESCLASDQWLKYIVVDPETGKVQNCKGGDIATLYRRFHGLPGGGKGNYQRPQTVNADFYVMGVDEDDRIMRNRVADVVYTGRKPVYRLTTETGFTLRATADHKIFTGTRYVRLVDLSAGDTVMVHNNTPYRGRKAPTRYPVRFVKWYYCQKPKKVVSNGVEYFYYRVATHRLSLEAHMNGLTLEQYVDMLNSGIDALPEDWRTIPEGLHVRHRDEDRENYDPENLELVDPSYHGVMHATVRQKNLRFTAVEDRVRSIEPDGEDDTYDVKCFFPYNNYVAGGIVTHNSGKTTVATRAVARMQQKYPDMAAAFIDVEGTYDPEWGAIHGVDNDRLVLVQPESGEVALDVAEAVIRSRETSICVVDSLAALTPAKETEGSVGDNNVGGQGLMIGRFMRKATSAMIGERKRDHWPTLLMVNQWRQKIGVMYGSPNTLPGGMAPKYFCSAMVEVMNKEKLGGAEHGGAVLLNEHSFRVRKNKIGNSLREGEFQMTRSPEHYLGQGFVDDAKTVVGWAKKNGVITGGGSSWRVDGLDEKFGKLDEIVAHFYSDLDFFDAFKMRLITMQREKMGKAAGDWY